MLRHSEAFFAAFSEEPLRENATMALDAAIEIAFREPPSLDTLAEVFGDFADLKCPVFLGHSRTVATLALRAARRLGYEERTLCTLRRAAHLADVGRGSVPNRIWSKRGALAPHEWERVRLHPYYGRRPTAPSP